MLEIRSEFSARLVARRPELEAAILAQIQALCSEAAGPQSSEGLLVAVSAALDYGFSTVELGDGHSLPLPQELLAQVRLAAQCGVGLEIVLRCYFAGYSALREFLIEEAEAGGFLEGAGLGDVLRSLTDPFDRIIAAVAEEYRSESERNQSQHTAR